MKKLCVLILLPAVFAGVVFGSYNVSGYVYNKATGLPVSGAIVYLTSYLSGGGSATNSTSTDSNGYYSVGWQTGNFVGNSMHLSAKSGFLAGGTSWTATSSSETKSLKISSSVVINPDLRLVIMPGHLTQTGLTDPFEAVAYVEPGGVTVELASFNAIFKYNPEEMSIDEPNIMAAPGVLMTGSFVDPISGTIEVSGQMDPPVHLMDPANPTPLLAFNWQIPDLEKKMSPVKTDPNTEMRDTSNTPFNPAEFETQYLIGTPNPEPYFLIDDLDDWNEAFAENIRLMSPLDWENYWIQWHDSQSIIEGEPYPPTQFLPPDLFVWEGDGDGDPCEPDDAGLVMKWGEDSAPDGNYASAWIYDYGVDPDLSNSTIQITVTPPSQCMITRISFGIQDINGAIRSWWWSVGPTGVIPYDVPTTITINTAGVGTAATTPVATGSLVGAGFDITKAQQFLADENATWVGGPLPVPPFGQVQPGLWNYWHNLVVTKNTTPLINKGVFKKWAQPPMPVGDDPRLINGWDEWSDYNVPPIMADDWLCTDERPVTDIHWWGSFQGWDLQKPPSIMPKAFHIGIWTDVPANVDLPYSHPGKLIWENWCDSYVWNYAGVDVDPLGRPEYEGETCFQFNQLLSEDEWFWQEPNEVTGTNVYWLSIAAVYDSAVYDNPDFHRWGWKTRPHNWNDDAVRIQDVDLWPLRIGSRWLAGQELVIEQESWDLAFELTTNEEIPEPFSGDINESGWVDFYDLAILADQWLTAGP